VTAETVGVFADNVCWFAGARSRWGIAESAELRCQDADRRHASLYFAGGSVAECYDDALYAAMVAA